MNELDLPQEYHIPFLRSHNQVVRPHTSAINPYHLGFHIFTKIEKEKGLDECFFIREVHDDASAVRSYLDIEDYRELNLFTYSSRKDSVVIDEISDEKGWKEIRKDLLLNIGTNSIPRISVSDISNNGDLVLNHDHDGRDLDLDYADAVVFNMRKIWPNDVKLFTIIEEESFEI